MTNLANQKLMTVCYRLPVIFLKDVSSKDFERLLWYMYKGEVGSRITRNTLLKEPRINTSILKILFK